MQGNLFFTIYSKGNLIYLTINYFTWNRLTVKLSSIYYLIDECN